MNTYANVLALAAQTAAGNSTATAAGASTGASFLVTVTAVSGTNPVLTPILQRDTTGAGNWVDQLVGSPMTAVGTQTLVAGAGNGLAGSGAVAILSPAVTQAEVATHSGAGVVTLNNAPGPVYPVYAAAGPYRVRWTIAGTNTPSFTMQIDGVNS